MTTGMADVDKVYLNYYVVFQAVLPEGPYHPVNRTPWRPTGVEGAHLFDPDLKTILPAVWYCLNLPRHGLDTIDLTGNVIAHGFNVPHNIILVPNYMLCEMDLLEVSKRYPPTLVISEDPCYDMVRLASAFSGSLLGLVSISHLSKQLLGSHWATITAAMRELPKPGRPLMSEPTLVAGPAKSALPLIFTANQLGHTDALLGTLESRGFTHREAFATAVQMRARLNTIVDFEQRGYMNPSREEFLEAYQSNLRSARVPLVLTAPGTPSRRRGPGMRSEGEIITSTEREVIDILGVHRAAARNGVWWDFGNLPSTLFSELHRLELHCQASHQANRFVWDSLRRIGRHLAKHLGNDGLAALGRTSHITAFSDFPIGLAVLPGSDDPLCCVKPISYRPLTPLTRTLQMELERSHEYYIGRGFKVIIAECLSPDDRIRPLSDAAWSHTCDMLSQDKRVQVVHSEVLSVAALKQLLEEHTDADILVISAHGCYAENHSFAGLWVGDDVWLAEDDDIRVPPVVILSACHVAPRGAGAVTVSDLLLRVGAIAVLGTLIPVEVTRNATLMCRLFSYISEALAGSAQFRSLDEAWQWVVASNAVHEILESSDALMEWAHERPAGRPSPIEEFKLNRASGRLRNGHIYADTISVLQEMMAESGLDRHLNAVLSSQGFFPESCFYLMLGSPENVLLHEPVIEEIIDRGYAGHPGH